MNFRNVTRNILEDLNDYSTIGRRENTEIDDSNVFRKIEKFTDSVTNGQYSELGDKLHTLKCTVDETSEYKSSLLCKSNSGLSSLSMQSFGPYFIV